MAADLLGRWGESLAAEYLRRQRYELLAVNYRCRLGEIDLIARKGQILAFVEVKLRKNADFAYAMESVDRRKQERIRKSALLYLAQLDDDRLRARFDVIEIYAPQGTGTKKPRICHMEDAFQ